MSITTNTQVIAKVAAVLAGAGLVLSSFAVALPAGAQTTTTTTTTSTSSSMMFTRDLTIGSTGADVTALQTWLISRGHSIPAGATGYFGAQTQAALAAYQAANAITPAAGYFGPITRARALAVTQFPAPAPAPSDDNGQDTDDDGGDDDRDDEDMNDDEDDAAEAIDDARDALEDARDEVEEADDDGEDTDDAEDLLDDAGDTLDDAEEALDDEEYEEATDLADEAEDLIDEALDEIESNNDDNDDDDSDTEQARNRSEFRFELDIEAFGRERELTTSDFEFNVTRNGSIVSDTAVTRSTRVESDDFEDNGGTRVELDEDEEGRVIFTVNLFADESADNGSYTVTLESVGDTRVNESLTETLTFSG